ncbi:hypothetical protein SMIDD26_01233 [Streptococcus mitis]|uniref:Uncharacterized protein n=2 Tax=Streptococcus TaxID=1301 RepID=A0A139PQ20_STRMT|nr:hypothetical protein SMIDD26_01233 [Streptococcus mitis]
MMKKRFENIILVSMICMSILPTNVYAKDNREIEKEFTIDVTNDKNTTVQTSLLKKPSI